MTDQRLWNLNLTIGLTSCLVYMFTTDVSCYVRWWLSHCYQYRRLVSFIRTTWLVNLRYNQLAASFIPSASPLSYCDNSSFCVWTRMQVKFHIVKLSRRNQISIEIKSWNNTFSSFIHHRNSQWQCAGDVNIHSLPAKI